jgi:hypothetical protein
MSPLRVVAEDRLHTERGTATSSKPFIKCDFLDSG